LRRSAASLPLVQPALPALTMLPLEEEECRRCFRFGRWEDAVAPGRGREAATASGRGVEAWGTEGEAAGIGSETEREWGTRRLGFQVAHILSGSDIGLVGFFLLLVGLATINRGGPYK
jgi:hypothetical protein